MSPLNNKNGFITFVGAVHCGRPVREPAVGLPYCGKNYFLFGMLKNAQMQVEPCEIPFAGAPEILRRERFKTVPYRGTPQQACPVLDTGKDEPACR